jgi:hypothetical protein
MNPDGGFTYTPSAGLRATGGTDSFTYTASYTDRGGVPHAAAATVTLFVVKVDLQMAGVDPAHKLDVGGFVPINANNDNRSDVTNEIPKKRDDTELVDRDGKRFVDNDLKPVNIVVNPNVGLPGFFVLSATNSGVGQIKLWTDNTKPARAESTYTQATLPSKIYVEGTEPGAALRESEVSLTYLFVTASGLPIDAGADRVKVTVTPVITNFAITPGQVVFANGTDGRAGMKTTGAGPLGTAGALFDATMTRTGAAGNVTFIQNFLNVVNGAYGVPAGWVFTAASGRPKLNMVLTQGANFPILDKDGDTTVSPDYDNIRTPVWDANTQRITAEDSPDTLYPAGSADLTNIAIVFKIKLYLVWRFPGANNSVIYTLGTRTWDVVFFADQYVQGQGVTRNGFPNGVVPAANFDRTDHSDPVVVGPPFNRRVGNVPA